MRPPLPASHQRAVDADAPPAPPAAAYADRGSRNAGSTERSGCSSTAKPAAVAAFRPLRPPIAQRRAFKPLRPPLGCAGAVSATASRPVRHPAQSERSASPRCALCRRHPVGRRLRPSARWSAGSHCRPRAGAPAPRHAASGRLAGAQAVSVPSRPVAALRSRSLRRRRRLQHCAHAAPARPPGQHLRPRPPPASDARRRSGPVAAGQPSSAPQSRRAHSAAPAPPRPQSDLTPERRLRRGHRMRGRRWPASRKPGRLFRRVRIWCSA